MITLSINKKTLVTLLFTICFLVNPSDIFSQNSITIHQKNGKGTININNNTNDLKIEYNGDITLTDDEKDIKSISRGGYIEIKKSSFGKRRRIVIRNDEGELIRKFFVGWSEKDFYPEGKKWLEDILPEILKSTTIAAKARVDRYYKKGGANEVLSEIKKMDSDYLKNHYFKLLLGKNLSKNDIINTIITVGETIKSDHYLSNILKTNQQLFFQSPQTIDAYIAAIKNINSNHYITQILKNTISDRGISDNQLTSLLKVSENIDSDHYLSEILKEIMNKRELNKQSMEQIMKLSKALRSNHYKSLILKKALRSKKLSKEAYSSFMSTLDDIDSDHYTTDIINELMKNSLDTENLNKVLSIIEKNISSTYYTFTIYKKIASRNDLTESQIIRVMNAAKNIHSDHYLSQTLLAFAPHVRKGSEKLKEVYKSAAKSIKSDTYFGRTIKELY